jgi:hypothetical protein
LWRGCEVNGAGEPGMLESTTNHFQINPLVAFTFGQKLFLSLRQLLRSRARTREQVDGYHPTGHLVLAHWRSDRRAGKGILIEGYPSGEMHYAVVRLGDRQPGCVLNHLLDRDTGVPSPRYAFWR